MIIYNKLDNYFVVSPDRQSFLAFEMTANLRDTSPFLKHGVVKREMTKQNIQIKLIESNRENAHAKAALSLVFATLSSLLVERSINFF